MSKNLTYDIANSTIVPSNNCSKATLQSSTIISNTVQMNFTMTLASSSMYTLFIVINGVISKQQSFQSPHGKSSSVVAYNTTIDFGSNRLQVVWSPPSSPNGQILGYNVWLQDIYNTCISQWRSTCSNCGNMIAGVQDSSNIQCLTNYNVSFKNTDQILSVQSNNSKISPFTNYKVSVVAINGYGWGDIKVVSFISGEYISGQVRNLGMFSTWPMNITWSPPLINNGQIIQYILLVQNPSNQTCVLWLTVDCSDCTTKSNGSNDFTNKCSRITYNETFMNSTTSITVPVVSSSIRNSTLYNISVVPVNGYGWGIVSSIISSTNQMNSGSVINAAMTSSFPDWPLNVTWTPPTTPNGQIVKYIVLVQDTGCISWLEINCSDCTSNYPGMNGQSNITNNCSNVSYNTTFSQKFNNISVAVISRLIQPFTQYYVSVVPVNGYGWGNISSAKYTTAPYYPTVVKAFRCVNLTYNSFLCSWLPPDRINDRYVNYTIDCRDGSTNYTVVVASLSTNVSQDVNPDTNYTCSITACNSVGCSSNSQTSIVIAPSDTPDMGNVSAMKDIMSSASSRPNVFQIPITLPYSLLSNRHGRIVNLSLVICINGRFLIGKLPDTSIEKIYADCDKGNKCPYVIHLTMPVPSSRLKRDATGRGSLGRDIQFTVGDQSQTSCNGPLAADSTYSIGFRACTRAGCSVVIITKRTSIDLVPILTSVILISVCVAFVIMVVIFIRTGKIKCPGRQLIESASLPMEIISSSTNHLCPLIVDYSQYYQSLVRNSNMIASEQFIKLTETNKALQSGHKLIMATDHDMKNRYRNIKPYKHNIIKLEGQDDYINASRICLDHCCLDSRRNCNCKNYYIATQGPNGNDMEGKTQTMGDFWKMVLQYNVSMIINLTKCMENYKEKCAQYWPEIGIESYISGESIVTVEVKNIISNKSCVERIFLVSMGERKKLVIQLQYTVWYDHCCPSIEDFFEFYERYNGLKTMDQPVLVHCSAGVGRTGTFILVDIMIKKINNGASVIDIYDTLLKLRQCRVSMVQTENQYVFVHQVIDQYLKKTFKQQSHEQFINKYANQNQPCDRPIRIND